MSELISSYNEMGDRQTGPSGGVGGPTVLGQPAWSGRGILDGHVFGRAGGCPRLDCLGVGGGPSDALDQLRGVMRTFEICDEDPFVERHIGIVTGGWVRLDDGV
jgi:hypothetical protein